MDHDGTDPGDAFAIPDLWGPSNLLRNSQADNSFLFEPLQFADLDKKLPDISVQREQNDGFFSIPDLSIGPTAEVTPPREPTASVEQKSEALEYEELEDVDIWLLPHETPIAAANFQSWDAFEKQRQENYHTPYLTEAGPSTFDTILALDEDNLRVVNGDSVVIDSKIYASSVLALGLGRSSVLFTWDVEKTSFCPTLPEMRISGYTTDTLSEFMKMFVEIGNITRFLQSHVDEAYSRNVSPGRIALADAVSTLLTTIQTRLSVSVSSRNSILQLHAQFQPAHSVLTCFHRIIVIVSATRSDESLLSSIFQEIQLLEHRTDSLKTIMLEVLSRVSQPWLEFTSEWLGLQREVGLPLTKQGSGKSFVKVEQQEWIDDQGLEIQEPDYALNYDKVPSFLAPDDARAMFEVGKSLRFLREHHADHPLARSDTVLSADPPALEWLFSWQDIVKVEEKALQYEKKLMIALQQYAKDPMSLRTNTIRHHVDPCECKSALFGQPEEDMQAHILASINDLDMPLKDSAPDRLADGLDAYLHARPQDVQETELVFAPPISLVPTLSFNPIIAAQARLVNGTSVRMFFASHKLREHLSVQRSFQLLGNGVFSSRLSHALFDPELESAERSKGIARNGGIMGLRLGGRDTWPPASSELRLALMGVMTESYVATQPLNKSTSSPYNQPAILPGDLSFSVRDMSEEEIEKCMNPDSVEALDFLRISYKPPRPLEAVITPVILFKYDQLFKLLLRVMRMVYVISALFRDATDRTSYWQGIDNVATRFRIEAHHFVSCISGYFFDTGIEATWRVFERKLDQVESRIRTDQDYNVLGQSAGLDKLRDYHERVLDRIMFALLLRKRQQPVMNLLEEIFALILQFSKHSRERALGLKSKTGADEEVRGMYVIYRKKVGVFITVCKGLSEKKGYGEAKATERQSGHSGGLFDGDDLKEENTISQLLARLEMSNYYSKVVKP